MITEKIREIFGTVRVSVTTEMSHFSGSLLEKLRLLIGLVLFL